VLPKLSASGDAVIKQPVSLVVPSTRRTTLGDRAFPDVAAATAWNDLPPTIWASPSLLMFNQQLKTFLFRTTFY